MQYQIEFLDDVNTIVRMAPTIAESPAIAFQLVLAKGWPRGARTAHVIDSHGHLTKFKIQANDGVDVPDRLQPFSVV